MTTDKPKGEVQDWWLFYDDDKDRAEDWFTSDLKKVQSTYRKSGIHVVPKTRMDEALAEKELVIKGFQKLLGQSLPEFERLTAENQRLRNVLREIANEDYRGNRSNASVKAYNALKGDAG